MMLCFTETHEDDDEYYIDPVWLLIAGGFGWKGRPAPEES